MTDILAHWRSVAPEGSGAGTAAGGSLDEAVTYGHDTGTIHVFGGAVTGALAMVVRVVRNRDGSGPRCDTAKL